MISFFKVPKYRVFEYKPRFYNPDKERLEARKRELGLMSTEDGKEHDGSTPNKVGDILRSGVMRARHEQFSQKMEMQSKRSRRMLIVFVVLLSLLAFYILK